MRVMSKVLIIVSGRVFHTAGALITNRQKFLTFSSLVEVLK